MIRLGTRSERHDLDLSHALVQMYASKWQAIMSVQSVTTDPFLELTSSPGPLVRRCEVGSSNTTPRNLASRSSNSLGPTLTNSGEGLELLQISLSVRLQFIANNSSSSHNDFPVHNPCMAFFRPFRIVARVRVYSLHTHYIVETSNPGNAFL